MTIETSILILTKNEEKNIGKCIESILSSNYPGNKYEIILVDSNSEDRTIEIAKNYGIKIYKLSRGSIGTALNIVLEKSNGIYCFKVDGDSIVPPDFIKDAIEILKKERNTAAVTGKRIENNKNNLVGQMYAMRFAKDKFGYISTLGGNFIFNKNIVKRTINKFPDSHCAEERLMCMKLNTHGYKTKRIGTISMIHDSSGENISLLNFIKKNIWYAYENYVLFKHLTNKERIKYADPHFFLLLIIAFSISLSLYFKDILFLLVIALIYIAVCVKFFSKRVYFGTKIAIITAFIDSFLFYIRSLALLYYLLKPSKTEYLKVEEVT